MARDEKRKRGRPKSWHDTGDALRLLRSYESFLESLRNFNAFAKRRAILDVWGWARQLARAGRLRVDPDERGPMLDAWHPHIYRIAVQIVRHRADPEHGLERRAALLAWGLAKGRRSDRDSDIRFAWSAVRTAQKRISDEKTKRTKDAAEHRRTVKELWDRVGISWPPRPL